MENMCVIDLNAQTINILNVFAGQTGVYSSSIVIILENVVNPQHNKEKVLGFTIFTYADGFQQWQIDILPNNVIVPTLKCAYPCRTCLESDSGNCRSCWTDDFSDMRYFYEFESAMLGSRGLCGTGCPDGMSRNNNPDYVCRDCD